MQQAVLRAANECFTIYCSQLSSQCEILKLKNLRVRICHAVVFWYVMHISQMHHIVLLVTVIHVFQIHGVCSCLLDLDHPYVEKKTYII